jgi:four helix bundle protein
LSEKNGLKLAYSLNMLKNFRAFQLAKEFYQICKTLKLPVHLKDQLMRASSSTALNLAESSGERTEKERDRYFTVARGYPAFWHRIRVYFDGPHEDFVLVG